MAAPPSSVLAGLAEERAVHVDDLGRGAARRSLPHGEAGRLVIAAVLLGRRGGRQPTAARARGRRPPSAPTPHLGALLVDRRRVEVVHRDVRLRPDRVRPAPPPPPSGPSGGPGPRRQLRRDNPHGTLVRARPRREGAGPGRRGGGGGAHIGPASSGNCAARRPRTSSMRCRGRNARPLSGGPRGG